MPAATKFLTEPVREVRIAPVQVLKGYVANFGFDRKRALIFFS
jgi:hypothetical protein